MATTTTENRALRYTVFDRNGYSPQEDAQAWAELFESLKDQQCYTRKEDAPLIKLACFGDTPSPIYFNEEGKKRGGSYRHDKNVQEVTGIEGDIDSGLLGFDKAKQMLEEANIKAIVSTTWNYTPSNPHLRVLAPLSVPHKPSERKELAGRLNHILGGHLASESFNLSQSFFLGRNPEGEYRVEHTFDDPAQGQCLDELDAPPFGEEEAPTESPSVGVKNEDLQAAEDAGLSPEHLGGGKWKVLCPWRDEHTEEGGSSSTAYFEPHTNGYEGAGFRCLHHHCAERGIRDFRQFLGLQTKSVVERMNEKHALVLHRGKPLVVTEFPQDTKQKEIQLSRFADIKQWYTNQLVQDGDRKKNIADVWLKSPHRRQFPFGLKFDPSSPGHDAAYNLWQGLAVAPAPGNWDRFRDHIWTVLCRRNEGLYRYVLDWLADLVQHPEGPKPGVALVLKGQKGGGKGTFATTIGRLFGVHFLHLQGPDHLTAKFNSHFREKILVFGDEAVWGGDKRSEGRLKGLITEETTMIEEKYMDSYEQPNYMRFIFASNEGWSVPSSLDERRFLVLNIDNSRAKEYGYFEAIHQEMENGGLEAMLHDLLNRGITSNLREAPKTEGLWEEALNGMKPEEKWFFEFLNKGHMLAESGSLEVEKHKVKGDYDMFCSTTKVRKPTSESVLTKEIKRLCPNARLSKRRDGNGRQYVWEFPALEKAREDFEQAVGWPGMIPWD